MRTEHQFQNFGLYKTDLFIRINSSWLTFKRLIDVFIRNHPSPNIIKLIRKPAQVSPQADILPLLSRASRSWAFLACNPICLKTLTSNPNQVFPQADILSLLSRTSRSWAFLVWNLFQSRVYLHLSHSVNVHAASFARCYARCQHTA